VAVVRKASAADKNLMPQVPARHGKVAWLPRGGALVAAAIALSALAGWVVGAREPLTWGGTPAIKVGTVLAFVACAGVIVLLDRPSPRGQAVARGLCAVVGLWALLVVVEWATGRALGIDHLFIGDDMRQGFGGRPSPLTAASLLVLSGALAALDAPGRRARTLHLLLLTALLGNVSLAAAGWLFGAGPLTGAGRTSGMALPTLTALVALLGATLTLRPERPPFAWARRDAPAGPLLRRLVPAAVLVPILLGTLEILGEKAGLYDQRFGVALLTATMMVLFLVLVLTTARTIDERSREGHALGARLEAILDHMPGAVYLCDPEGRLQTVNRACAEALGAPAEELIGRTLREILGDEEMDATATLERPLTERGEVVVYEQSTLHPDGSEEHRVVTKYPVRGEQGELIGVGGVALDITDRKRAEQALASVEQRLRRLLEAAPDAMVVVDAGGRIESVNAQALRLFGYERAELVGQSLELLMPEAHRAAHAGHRARFAATPKFRSMGSGLALRAVRKDGTECPVEISLSPLETDDGLQVIAAIRDVTERARDEAEQDALRRVATAVAEDAGAPALFQLVAEEVARVLDVDNGIVVRFESEHVGTVLGLRTAEHAAVTDEHLDLGGGHVVSLVARTGQPARLDSYPDDAPGRNNADLDVLQLRAGVAAPIRVGGRLWGAVGAATTGDAALPANGERRVERFADLVATAISNAQAWDKLARLAATDGMTGLPNHRTFHTRLREEVERARRHGRSLSVVLFDVDGFKHVNDTHGHHAGDAVLAELARRLTDEVREGEMVARVGGEEFAWLLPETSAAGAIAAAERARLAVASRPFDPVGAITVSAGVCGLEDCGEGDLLRMADRALYWAKDAGRNVTFRYTDEAQEALAVQPSRGEQSPAMSSVRALARAIDAKDLDTRRHSERVADLSELLALRMGWTMKRARLLHAAALLHDVGKIGVPDSILLKPSGLTPEEYTEVKRHPAIGARIAAEVLDEEPTRWVRHHHERWDGSGYPDGLAGDDIPDGAQLLALADAWDVMTTIRTYQETRSLEDAWAECRSERGRQFAPDVVDALLALSPEELGNLVAADATGDRETAGQEPSSSPWSSA
jgi:diguanylate cyclase (GGDEF)-like protein/PAS domain S-box-containing protein